jgi:2-keto-4-pentenoate hydratase/2-oxohepta-3-ene-1,7-dioic acid hydratase in catechol pathway
MRWCRINFKDRPTFGIIEGDRINLVAGSPFSEDGYKATKDSVPLEGTKLLAPVIPPTFYATGRNYAAHLADRVAHGASTPESAWASYRASNALVGTGETVIIPADCPDDVEYEGELVAVIGKKSRHLTHENALDAVFGYTIGNDITGMTWARGDPRPWRSKSCDTWKPMGPWIETEFDVEQAIAKTIYNDKVMVEFKVTSWRHGVADVLVALSKYMTLHPGDILWMGAEGVSPYMKHGDVVEIQISGIGSLRNPVVREGVA